jgi:serine/threonine protein kinase
MICVKCGHHNSDSARYCATCGQMLPAVERASLTPGQTMNNAQYRIVRQVGKGGMGTVYIAQNTQAFDRLCIIKEMIPYYEPGQEDKARDRFELEARTLAALKHPNIPDMYGFFSEHGHNYIVMEYIEGKSLDKMLEEAQGPLKAEDVIRFGVEICRVLEYLAQITPAPVVHCDIKPGNIIIEQNSNQAVLVDFGTAKSRYRTLNTAQPDAKHVSVYGTVGYAPPELYRGEAEPKSDVFSLAATMYHLISGDDPRDHPFQWPGMPRIPAPLATIIQQALATELNQRPTAEQFRQQLEAYRAGSPGAVEALHFPDGNQATTLTGVLDLALRNWGYSQEILYNGSLLNWLQNKLNNQEAAARAAEAVKQFPQQPNGGLDLFLRSLNPRLPVPAIAVAPQVVNLGYLQAGDAFTFKVSLSNGGPGGCRGTIECSETWLKSAESAYALGPGDNLSLTFTIRAGGNIPTDRPLEGVIQLKHALGQPSLVKVHLEVRSSAPNPLIRPTVKPITVQNTKPNSIPARKAPKRPNKRLLWLVPLFIVLGMSAYFGYGLIPPGTTSDAEVKAGIESLQKGEWQAAFKVLKRISADNNQQITLAGAALDNTLATIAAGEVSLSPPDTIAGEAVIVAVVGFALQRFEVTNLQWQRYVNDGHLSPPGWPGGHFPNGQALLPVVGITWEQAQAYAAWAGLRLPSESEWMLAARSTQNRSNPWGNNDDPHGGNFKSSVPSPGTRSNIGSFGSDVTPEGVYDLAGNIQEWTADYYAPLRLPYAPPSQGSEVVVLGSAFDVYYQGIWDRQHFTSTLFSNDRGFRCAK